MLFNYAELSKSKSNSTPGNTASHAKLSAKSN